MEKSEIQIKSSLVHCIGTNSDFLDLMNIPWLCKMLTIVETGERIYGELLYYLCNISTNL